MSINNELDKLRNDGYCLWVGAGVTKQLAGACVPDWRGLVEQIETHARISNPAASFPERLDDCLEKIDREKFQSHIRNLIYEPTKNAIRELAKKSTDPANVVPAQVRQLAHLGSLANPIVNFNVESFTSHALARPGGSFAIKSYVLSGIRKERLQIEPFLELNGSRYPRMVYHPHGAIDLTGLCVLGQKEYKDHKGSLAYELAIHAAFQSHLAIVGMSLDDRYLIEHLTDFRDQIRDVLWFLGGQPDKEKRNGRKITIFVWSSARGKIFGMASVKRSLLRINACS